MHCGAVWNICTLRYSCVIANRAVAADSSIPASLSPGTDSAVCVKKDIILHFCPTVYLNARIKQHTIADYCPILDTSILHQDTAMTNL